MSIQEELQSVRNFHRYYNNIVDFITHETQESEFSETEIRLLHEIEKHPDCTSSELSKRLSLDAGYLSRILSGLESRGLISRRSSERDSRSAHITLTGEGLQHLEAANARFDAQVHALLSRLPEENQRQLLTNIAALEHILTDAQSLTVLGC